MDLWCQWRTNNWLTGKFRELQRLTVQYARVLGITHETEGGEEGDGLAAEGEAMAVEGA